MSAAGFGSDGFLSLTLGADKQNLAALGNGVDDLVIRDAEKLHGLLQVDNMDAVAGAKNERTHLRVPAAGLVTEMNAGLQHLFHRNVSHVSILQGLRSSTGTLTHLPGTYRAPRAAAPVCFFKE